MLMLIFHKTSNHIGRPANPTFQEAVMRMLMHAKFPHEAFNAAIRDG